MPSPTRRFRSAQSHRPDDREQDFQERASAASDSEAPLRARDSDDEEAARLLKPDAECTVSSLDGLELEQHGYSFRWSKVLVTPLSLLWSVRKRTTKTIQSFQPDGSQLDAAQRSLSPQFRKLRRFAIVLLLFFAML